MRAHVARQHGRRTWTRKYFPLIATIFIFILVTNLIGYIPLPVDSGEKFKLFGAHIPSFQIYAADTNVAFPLMLALGVFIAVQLRGRQAPRPDRLPQEPDPGRRQQGRCVPLIFPIEILSIFLRLVSLTVRLWANLLAGHLLIAFMGGELGVLARHQLRAAGSCCRSGRDLPVRGRPDRRPAGLHLCHPDRHLPRQRGRQATNTTRSHRADAASPLAAVRSIRCSAPRNRHASRPGRRPRDRARRRRRRRRRGRRRGHRHAVRQGDRGETRQPEMRDEIERRSSGSASRSPRPPSSTAWSAASSPSSCRPT